MRGPISDIGDTLTLRARNPAPMPTQCPNRRPWPAQLCPWASNHGPHRV